MSDSVESEERRLSESESDQIWEENIYMSGCNVVFKGVWEDWEEDRRIIFN